MPETKIEQLKKMIAESGKIVFLGGAGVSVESGIPDFRSSNGIFKAIQEFGYSPEELLSHSFYVRKPEVFFKYYKTLLMSTDAKPNDAHLALAELEKQGKLTAVVTQNIDGLHQAAGSRHVCELHGSVYRNHCTKCRRFYSLDQIMAMKGVPTCECGGIIKPDVVLYGEGLDNSVVTDAIRSIREADTMIVGGTSLAVYPAAGLIDYFRGDTLIVINLSPTPRDREATLCVHEKIGEALSYLLD